MLPCATRLERLKRSSVEVTVLDRSLWSVAREWQFVPGDTRKRNTVIIVCLWNILFGCPLLKFRAITLTGVKKKERKKNGDVHRSEQTSQGLSDVYEINRLFHLFWSRMTGNYLLCPGRHRTLPAYTPIGAVAARLNSPSCCITCSMAARTMT